MPLTRTPRHNPGLSRDPKPEPPNPEQAFKGQAFEGRAADEALGWRERLQQKSFVAFATIGLLSTELL